MSIDFLFSPHFPFPVGGKFNDLSLILFSIGLALIISGSVLGVVLGVELILDVDQFLLIFLSEVRTAEGPPD